MTPYRDLQFLIFNSYWRPLIMHKNRHHLACAKKGRRSNLRLRPQFESLEQRILLVADWTPLGPFSATNGQVENIANKPIVGAIDALLAHPTNPNTLYVGSVNGGVWKSLDATASQPHWTPLTDSMPSQSISALTFDVADATSNTIVAGVGHYSSYAQIGNRRIGLMRSTNAGQNWQVVDGGGVLQGKNISGVYANGKTIVVSVNVADTFNSSNIGIFRSTNGGASFTQISNGIGASTGLPNGVSYDLVADPLSPSVLYTSIVFSTNGGVNGVYKSTNGGANWTKVSTPAMDALIVNNTSNLELSAGRNNEVYAGIVNRGVVVGLFRSPDNGLTWAALDLPQTNEVGGNVGLNPKGGKGPISGPPELIAGGQGDIHFSIVASPNNANVVYVGGDRQPLGFQDQGTFPNAIGANDFSGRLFRGDASKPTGSQFVHLTHRNNLGAVGGGTANNSAPHADSRDMAFDANGNLIEVDDGGVYRRTSPQNNTGDWFSVIGDLQVTEAHDVAWDSLSNVAMTGNQDTGSTYQPSENAKQWVSLTTGDGGDIAIDNIQLAGGKQSARYSSYQNLGLFQRTVWDASGGLVSTSFPALTPTAGSSAIVGAFRTPVETNSVVGGRLLIQGSNSLYESLNAGTTVTAIGVNRGVSGSGVFSNAIWYGGTQNNVANPDLVWAASGSDVFLRTSGTGSVAPTVGDPTTAEIRDLAVNTLDWANAFVIDDKQVFQSTNSGNTWGDITGNLLTLASDLRSISFVAGAFGNYILAGTNLGVFAAATSALGKWSKLGGALPNAIVFDMEYDVSDDILVVGTMGRGSWSLKNVTTILEATVDISLGLSETFVENGAAVLVAPTAKVTETKPTLYTGTVLKLAIGNNYQAGDFLDIASQGFGVGEISVVGTQVGLGGTLIGSYSGPGQSIDVTFNSAANRAAVEMLLTRISFVHTTDDPSPNPRVITAFLDNGQNGASNRATVLLDVVPVNDAPSSSNVSLPSIDEDTKNPSGVSIGILIGSSFQDPDRGSSLSGIAITSNDALINSGLWQYSVDAVNWRPIGSVAPAVSLVLSSSSRIRFLSSKDYFGRPTSLSYRALDETYSGGFTVTIPLILDVSAATIIGPVSLVDASIGIRILPVNDAPVTTVPSQATSVNQDDLLVFPIQDSWFTDVDNATLTHSFKSANGAVLPAWLSFNSSTGLLTGTPSNDEVGIYDLVLLATDAGGLFTTLKLQLSVINVNDRPTNIELVGNSVRENDFGVFIGTLFGTDKDRSDQFTWQVSDQRFAIQGNMLYLAPGIRLNYEVTPRIDLMIQVTDNGTQPGPLSLTLQKTIDVLDVNEFSPSLKATLFSVNESTLPLSEIGFLTAPDGDTNNRVRYRFNGTPPSLFSLDGTSGRVALKPNARLDHESVASYQFYVEAFDDGLPELGTIASVNITVTDFNEFDPEITNGVISISERQVTQVPFAKLTATDGDSSQSVRFFLPNSETRFSVNSTTGELLLNRSGLFDFETNSTDSIVVIAQDNGTPPRSVQRTLTLSIQDANDPPTAASVANTGILSNVSGLFLGKISIVDQDSGQLYTIVSSDDRFVIVDGNLFVAPGKGVGETDRLQMLVPIVATEIGSDGKSYALNIGLNRIPNTNPWQNRLNPLDVNRDDGVDPLDVLAMINALNGSEVSRLPLPRPASTLSMLDYDVDGDGTLNPLDVLAIINFINNKPSGEGEQERQNLHSETIQTASSDAAWLTAYTQIEEERLSLRRRRG